MKLMQFCFVNTNTKNTASLKIERSTTRTDNTPTMSYSVLGLLQNRAEADAVKIKLLRTFVLLSCTLVSYVVSVSILMSNQQRLSISILFCGSVGCQQNRCDCRLVRTFKIDFSVDQPCVASCASLA